MDNKPPKLWDGKEHTPEGLRLPNTPPTHLLEKEKTTSNPFTPPQNNTKVKSRLSADAPEFYPSYLQSPSAVIHNASSVQSRLKKHRPEVNSRPEAETNSFNNCDFEGSADDNRLKHLIVTLTKDPGQFSDLLDIFMDTLFPYFQDFAVLSRAALLLVEQAIDYPSFRYTAARLCCSIEQFCAEFRAELHLTCQGQLESHANKSGLLLFVAELYTQLHHDNIYGTYLLDAYKTLINLGGNDNIKAVCQALKLTGHSLELYNRNALDVVLLKLNEVKPSVNGTALTLISSVNSLRSSKWGRGTSSNANSTGEPEVPYWNDDAFPVFYNSDGLKFSSEESEFLAAHLNSTDEFLNDLSDPDELCDPEPEMDEEIQAAFRDFVKLSKR